METKLMVLQTSSMTIAVILRLRGYEFSVTGPARLERMNGGELCESV
jgi:hypothetical protein